MSPSRKQRGVIAEDTIARIPSIVASTRGASLDSTFIKNQLPPLDRSSCPGFPKPPVQVTDLDAFTTARNILQRIPEERGKLAVLNLASDEYQAGGWRRSLSQTQEEALCYSSTLFGTLKQEYYPWPNTGEGSVAGIYSPGIVIFKHDLDHDCLDLSIDNREVVSVITVAAPRFPEVIDGRFAKESELEDLRGKIRLIYRMAAHNGQHVMVLGAMGCGAYACPPRQVAEEMKSILLEEEFEGWFKEIAFAVYANNRVGGTNNKIFKEILQRA